MLNWLVVGIGDIAVRRVIPAIQAEPRSTLYGVVTRDAAKGRAYSERVWTDLGRALWDDQINAVYVATPPALHAPQSLMSLRSGKHVLCEKPMAMNLEEAKSMVDGAERSGSLLGIAYYRRLYPKVQRAMTLLREGVIGQPVLAEIDNRVWFDANDGVRTWVVDPQMAGGGPLFDIGSHRIDLLNYFFGQPLGVCAHLSNVVHNTDVEDSATLIIEYQTAVRGIVDVRWHCHAPTDGFRIIGTQGVMDLSPLNGPRLSYPGGEEQIPAPENLHYPCIENFVSAVLDGTPLVSSAKTAAWTDWVTEQALYRENGQVAEQ